MGSLFIRPLQKSPGIDGIFPALLQKGLDVLIFRARIAYGYIPVQWRTSRVVFVPKPGLTDYTHLHHCLF